MATVPGAPTDLVATYSGSGAVSISFTPGSNGGSAITNYEYSDDGGESWYAFDPVDTTSPVAISGLTNGQNYFFTLRAVNSVGGGASSEAVEYMAYGPADAPTDLISANKLNGIISVSFTEGSNQGSGIFNYEYSLDGGATFEAFSPEQAASPVSISGLTNNTHYSIVLRAMNDAPESASSATLNIFYMGSGSFNNTGTFSNDGTFNTTGTVYNTLLIYNSVTITNDGGTGIVYNVGPSGEIFNNIPGIITNSAIVDNTGSIYNDIGTILDNNGYFYTSNGGLLSNGGDIDNTGSIYNASGNILDNNGFLYTYGGGLLSNDGEINNTGSISTSTGEPCGVGTLTNTGTITDIDAGTQNTDCPP